MVDIPKQGFDDALKQMMGNGAPDMNTLMKQAKDMQDQLKKIQDKMATVKQVGQAGAGLVKVTMNGEHQTLDVMISPTLVGEDEEMIGDLVKAANNDAANKIKEATKQMMMELSKDMKLPEGFGGIST